MTPEEILQALYDETLVGNEESKKDAKALATAARTKAPATK